MGCDEFLCGIDFCLLCGECMACYGDEKCPCREDGGFHVPPPKEEKGWAHDMRFYGED